MSLDVKLLHRVARKSTQSYLIYLVDLYVHTISCDSRV